jgi:hypothetical protein
MNLCIHDLPIGTCAWCSPPADTEFAAEMDPDPAVRRGTLARGWDLPRLGRGA